METVEGYVDSPGTVYICDGSNPDGSSIEFCWDGAAEEIEESIGLDCHATGLFERTSLVGCFYHCDDPSTPDVNEGAGRGANAHNGCWCEP